MTQARFDAFEDGSVREDGAEVEPFPKEEVGRLEEELGKLGATVEDGEVPENLIGWTMFDTPQARDGIVVGLLPREKVGRVPHHALVRIESEDDRSYLGVIVEGPFREPDGLRADAPLVVTVTSRGGRMLMPRFHGRAHVEILGQEVNGGLVPPQFRPMPNSRILLLSDEETARVLRCTGDLVLGQAIGYENLVVGVPSDRKSVLPRHTAVLGTTGAGKSTTVSRIVYEAQKEGMAVILLDVEGEYTAIYQEAQEEGIRAALEARGMKASGVKMVKVFHPVGRETTAEPDGVKDRVVPFTLRFSRLSPYTVTEILEMTDAQVARYWQAYELAKALLRQFKVFPRNPDEERMALELDEFETGYPGMTLSHLLDIAGAILHHVRKEQTSYPFWNQVFADNADTIKDRIRALRPENEVSWRALIARLWRLFRLNLFDRTKDARPLDYGEMVSPGRVSIIDLSDTESPELRNLVIADVLRGVQQAQERRYQEAVSRAGQGTADIPRTLVIVEEAHEFLSAERIRKMPNVFQQVARIARRGRKRWLGLVFVTQHPQHLPDELFGLVNNYILHRINDDGVISRLRRSIGGIDASLWDRLPNLAPGQAVVSFTSLARPVLVAIDPTPCKLQMVE